MAKQKKKRNKAYTGAGAKVTQPTVVRVEAVQRSQLGQWWFEKKKFVRPVLIGAGVIFLLIILISELVRVFVG